METETAGDRLFLIRAACGNGTRDPEPLKAFAARVKRTTKKDYDPTTISLLERMKQNWRLDDVRVFAAVDPLARGQVWLSALDGGEVAEMPDPAKDRKLTMQEIQRAREQSARERGQAAAQLPPSKKRRGGAA